MPCAEIHPPPSGLSIATVEAGSTTTIRLCGELDLADRPTVHETLEAAFQHGSDEVVLDLSRLTFMDSTGVHLAAAARARASAVRSALTLIPGPAPVQRVFAIAHAVDRRLAFSWADAPVRARTQK